MKEVNMTKREKVKKLLINADKPMTSHEIAKLTKINWNTVRGALISLRRNGDVESVNRGLYKYKVK